MLIRLVALFLVAVLGLPSAMTSAKPGGVFATPIHIPEEIHAVHPVFQSALPVVAKQVVPVPEPQQVTYTRTDVLSRKVTSNTHPYFYDVAAPHSIKHTHYIEENIVRGDGKPAQPENNPSVEANFRKAQEESARIAIDVRNNYGQQEDAPQPRAPTSAPVKVSAPILRSGPPVQVPLMANHEESIKRELPPVPVARLQPAAPPTPLLPAPAPAPIIIGYPYPTAQVSDYRRTFYTPSNFPYPQLFRSAPTVIKPEEYTPPCNDEGVLETRVASAPETPRVQTEIHHGPGAISRYF
ncbi:hypothetical protein PPYR_10164 [Photinus pyralis]|uniref:DUF4794 domain-containing protein n=1 Tax=Photinus pyralis TaxID=7054 RepID=A0A5N4AFK1_PHOPY|nr:hypothetical protein PPYR_10164 [Photinus pyralis]